MRETMEPRYNQNKTNNIGRQFLSPQPRRDSRPDNGNTTDPRDFQKPFWKSQNPKSRRAKSRKMNLTLKDVNPHEEYNGFRGNNMGFEPSTNDSARGIGSRNDDSRRESNLF